MLGDVTTSPLPPIAGMPLELWTWLRESTLVRPHVVARARASLAAGERTSAHDVADAILDGPFLRFAPAS